MNSRALTRTEVPIYQGQKILAYLFANSLYLGWLRGKFNFNADIECSDLGGVLLPLHVTVINMIIKYSFDYEITNWSDLHELCKMCPNDLIGLTGCHLQFF